MKVRKVSNFERNVIIAMIGLGIVVIILGICSFLQFTKPYAVSKDGIKVEQPWVVKIGDDESFVVASKKDGQDIIEQVKNSYSTDNTQSESTTLSPEITVVEKELERGEDKVALTDAEDAVAEVVTANQTEAPVVTVRTVEQVTDIKAIDFKTEYEKSDELPKGETKVIQEGKKGKKTIVSQVVKENGAEVSKEVLSSAIEEKPVNKIVQEGTMEEIEEPEPATEPPTAPTATADNDADRSAAKSSAVKPAADDDGDSKKDDENKDKDQKKSNDSQKSEDKKEKDKDSDSKSKDDKDSKSKDDSDKKTETKSGSGQAVVDYALQFVGNPYVYGGTSLTKGTDCSGFTMSVFKKFGVSLPHSSSAQRSYGKKVSYSNAKPGDLICYSGHVAIYIGKGKIVHASTPSTGIKVSKATYKNILCVRRLVK